MWWLLWIPVWIGLGALGAYAAHCQIQNMQRMIDDTVKEALSKPVAIPKPNPIAKPKPLPSPPKPTVHKQPTVRKGGQVNLEGVTYESILVGNKEYVDIGLYYKALEAFYKTSAGGRTGDRS